MVLTAALRSIEPLQAEESLRRANEAGVGARLRHDLLADILHSWQRSLLGERATRKATSPDELAAIGIGVVRTSEMGNGDV